MSVQLTPRSSEAQRGSARLNTVNMSEHAPREATPPPSLAALSLIAVIFINMLGFGIIVPLLPFYAKSFDASAWQIFRKVRFPAALPQIFVGLKTAMPLAVIGAVIGELVAADAGLGFVINQAGGSADTALAFAAIALGQMANAFACRSTSLPVWRVSCNRSGARLLMHSRSSEVELRPWVESF